MNGYTVPVVFLLCSFGVGVFTLSGKGYYCRDPDTGELYPVNSTWPSKSFCGNYTCKIRRKLTEAANPFREIVVTPNMTQIVKSSNDKTDNEETRDESNNRINIVYPTEHLSADKFNTSERNSDKNDIESKEEISTEAPDESNDRYLTESEIETISKLLHNVKKSDLDAIVDIYNLAQDIYKDVNKISSNDKNKPTNIISDDSSKSYWYEPLSRYNKISDLENQASNTYPTVIANTPGVVPSTYLQRNIPKNDFRTLPYYYPMSNFQRQLSYVHPGYKQLIPEQTNKPCITQAPKTYVPVVPLYPQVYSGVIKKPFPVEAQKVIQPSVLLPYPFSYVQHYNTSAYPYNLYYDNPISHFDVKIENDEQHSKVVASDAKNAIDTSDKSIPDQSNDKNEMNFNVNTELKSKEKSKEGDKKSYKQKTLLDTLFEHVKIDLKKPEWQTDPLSASVLEDIKAHFEEKAKLLKPFSLRKKVKLERVGKVKKLDELNRDKRSAGDENNSVEAVDDFEVYIEKTTCQSDVDPGFYKMGNPSQPYPACCPQRIDENNR